jgi:peptidoglycan/xylan/chitin deacetylase (PgdA/CDA1 family)
MKQAALAAARWSGACAAARFATRRRIRILAYHGVEAAGNDLLNFDGFHVSPAVFRAHMEALSRYRVRPLEDAVSAVLGAHALEESTVCITFDDGYRNNLTLAAPILKEFGYPATFFVTTSYIEGSAVPWWFALRQAISSTRVPELLIPRLPPIPVRTWAEKRAAVLMIEERVKSLPQAARDRGVSALLETAGAGPSCPHAMMSVDDVQSLVRMGFSVGPHTAHHVALGAETPAVAEREARESIEKVAVWSGRRPLVFSYPYGRPEDIPDRVVAVLRTAGCTGAVTTSGGLNRRGDHPFRLRRLTITGNHRREAFETLVSGLSTWRSRVR